MESLETGIGLDIVGWFSDAPMFVQVILLPFHFIGSEYGYLLLLPIVFWCVDKGSGRRLLVLILGTALVNALLKAWWMRPRPFIAATDRIVPFFHEEGFGLPSGHTMFATALGVWLIVRNRDPYVRVAAVAGIVLMGISRMVHGVHYPQDVIAGWLIGGILAVFFVTIERSIGRWISGDPRPVKIVEIAGALAAVFVAAVLLFPEHETRKGIISTASALAFGACGACIEAGAIGYRVDDSVKHRVVRGLVGIASLLAVYLLLTFGYYAAVGDGDGIWVLLLYSLRYGSLGLWITLATPALFVRFRLARSAA
jgi:membrane-associated phospholipid phosphatase